jgi:methionyl-tRNA formyltransferase
VRAFSPRPGAWTTLDGRRLKVWRARVAGEPGGGAPGSFAGGAGGSFVVATGEGALTLEEVQPQGGRRMPGADFLRGRRGAAGKLS